ncbi:sulfurtransferase TusA family protein [Jeotgalibacillus proteolyticus]|uniref:sulfurtransferase TusA family protein n=1 Tax=Jeotgalibacillus proteolyticus TaxID=2082395 RepID=UPI003CF71693
MIQANEVLDAKGLACPMPIVKTKKAMNNLEPGQVIHIQATDKGSTADLKAWAESANHQYLGTVEEGDVLHHYLRKASGEEKAETTYEPTVSNEELQAALLKEDSMVLDVREEAEFAFSHIPGAKSIPLGALDEKVDGLDKDKNVYVICRTGSRSDLAAKKLTAAGFAKVYNVVPGMSGWNGETTSI